MNGTKIAMLKGRTAISIGFLMVAILAAVKLGDWIVAGEDRLLVYVAAACLLFVLALAILRSWRAGFYLFIVWLIFEDLVRKYLGNNMAIYFAKDVLAGLIYLSLLLALRRGRAKLFRPPFLLAFSLFFWWGVLEVFNFNSPSVLYGLLGMKIYFFYFPLVFVGYALIRDESDLRRFLLVSMVLAGIVSALGIIQAIVGPDFLNPATLAPQIRELGALRKVAPLTNEVFLLPSSVFVSSGRFGFYLTLVAIEGLGAIGYFVLAKARGRSIILVSIGLVAAAVLLSGSRGTLLYASISSVVLTLLFLWGAPWRLRQTHRLVRAIRNAVAFAALSLILLVLLFPRTVASRWAFYTETLSPESSVSQFDQRVWNYPMRNFFDAFSEPHWIMGNGIGTASLGIQYVAELLKQPTPSFWVEEGFGQLIVELGILGPFLWIVWTAALLWASWKAVRTLKQTRFFPIAMAILWYSFVLLYPMVYGGLDPFENYVNNAFLWILVGILFRLPEMAPPSPLAFVSAERSEAIARV